MSSSDTQNTDMHRFTHGNILICLIKFAIPFLLANLLISMYGAADVFIVSYFADTSALSATSTGAQVVMNVMALAIGLGIGGTILIGQYFGAKREDDVKQTIGTEFILFGIIAMILTCILISLAKPITDWMEAPAQAHAQTISYIRISGIGMIFMFTYEAISSVLRGLGDSKNPLKFVAIACTVNVLLDLLFVGYFHWGASGAAAATIIAQGVSATIAIWYLKARHFIFDFKRKSFKFIPQKAKMILKLGIPTAFEETILFLSFTVMAMVVNKFGIEASAVMGITNRIDGFMFLPLIAIGFAISVMAAQNMGAGEIKRARRSFYVGFLFSLAFAIPAFLLMSVWPEHIMRLASSNNEIIKLGKEFMISYSTSCLFTAVICCMDNFLNGCGRTTFTMTNSLISSIVFRIPLILTATTLFEIGFAIPLATIPQLFCLIIYFYSNRWKKRLITPQAG